MIKRLRGSAGKQERQAARRALRAQIHGRGNPTARDLIGLTTIKQYARQQRKIIAPIVVALTYNI
jgi:hypothetical protein